MEKRVFIAINLSDRVKEELAGMKKNWPTLACRWLKKETFHLTLAFLGRLRPEELNKVFEVTKKVSENNASFSIFLNKVTYGPAKTFPPRLIWVEGKSSEEFSKIKNELDEFLAQQIGFQPEKREFCPHITLARIKQWSWKRMEPEERPEVNFSLSLEIPVGSIEVMESILKKSGAEYTVLSSEKLSPRQK